ncbi:MAG TPA: MFS transporter, partial [Bryobacterales bacterium]|nr:MFS transporter [Bryobacterales bacterium]
HGKPTVTAAPATSATATRTRHWVLLLGFLLSAVTYLDRVCISAAAPSMTRDLGLTSMQMGYVFSVFPLAYAIFEVPSGWLGDRLGQRSVLTRIVACWSVFTMLTGVAWNYAVLVATRFVFGAAEAGAFPTLSRGLARWFPQGERAAANGVMWMGARTGGAIAPAIAALLIARIGWRATFALFGSVGFLWCAVFWRWYRDDPGDHPSVNAAELARIREGAAQPARDGVARGNAPWGRILSSGTMWALFGMYSCSAYGFWFFVTWLPTFLIREHGLSLERSGIYSSLPLAVGALGCLAGGALSDFLVRRTGNVKWARRAIGIGGFAVAAIGFAAAASVHSGLIAVLCLALAGGSNDMTIPVAWATVVDVGGRFGGTTSAFMNMASSLSAMLSPVSAVWLAARFGSFSAMLAVAAGVYVIGALLWLGVDPTATALDTAQ